MFEFCAAASCIPFHAEALKERALMPPVSVTMHACVDFPAFGAGLAPPLDGALPQPAAANTRPPIAMTPTSFIPPAGRKMLSFHSTPPDHGGLTAGSVRRHRSHRRDG